MGRVVHVEESNNNSNKTEQVGIVTTSLGEPDVKYEKE